MQILSFGPCFWVFMVTCRRKVFESLPLLKSFLPSLRENMPSSPSLPLSLFLLIASFFASSISTSSNHSACLHEEPLRYPIETSDCSKLSISCEEIQKMKLEHFLGNGVFKVAFITTYQKSSLALRFVRHGMAFLSLLLMQTRASTHIHIHTKAITFTLTEIHSFTLPLS